MAAMFLAHRDLLTASLMGFSSGYVTSNTKIRFDTFGGMHTGNTVKLGMSIQSGNWEKVGVYAVVLFGFSFGTLLALVMLGQSVSRQRLWLLVFSALLILVDLITLGIRASGGSSVLESLASALAAISLGAQNALSQKSNVVKGNTTFMTGNIQKMTEAVYVHFTKGLSPTERRAALVIFCTWSMYIVGGLVGAALSSCSNAFCTDWSLTPAACLLYGPGMLSMHIERPKAKPAANAIAAAAEKAAAAPTPEPTPNAEAPKPATLSIATSTSGIGVEVLSKKRPPSLKREDSVQGVHAVSATDGRRSLGEDPQL